MSYDTGNRKDVRAAEKASKQADAEERDVVVSLCDSLAGRRWVWDLLAGCHIFAVSLSDNPYHTAFAEGERNIGLRLFAAVMLHCPEQYNQMAREANERRITDEQRYSGGGPAAESEPDPSD